MMNFESPLPMAFSLSQLGGAEGSVPMMQGMSGLSGLGLLPMQSATTDEEKWRRLTEVIDKVKSRPGTVTKANLHALAARLGFSPLIEPREVTIAGGTVMIVVHFSPQEDITHVTFKTAHASTNLQAAEKTAAAVLHGCLIGEPGGASITNKLDAFAANLEKLAKIDMPNGPNDDTFNGFEAISGVYTSLRKLYVHEREMAAELLGATDEHELQAITEVTCKKSGRPRMNENGRIGLDLDYWIGRRHMRRKPRLKDSEHETRDPDTFTLSVLCETLQAGQVHQAARISDAWISDQVMKSGHESGDADVQLIDWLDPPPTLVKPSSGADDEHASINPADGKLPNVRFVAKLEPPLLIPGEAATQSGILDRSTYHALPSYLNALLLYKDPLDLLNSTIQTAPREIIANRDTLAGIAGKPELHDNTLRTRMFEQAILLHDITFDHPKQLIELLPVSASVRSNMWMSTNPPVQTLRQFAFLNALLKTSFPNARFPGVAKKGSFSPKTKASKSNVDMTFSTTPDPRLTLTFANGTASEISATEGLAMQAADDLDSFFADEEPTQSRPPLSVTVSILPNAQIIMGGNNISVEQATDTKGSNEKLAEILDIAADLDILVEWIRAHGAGTS